MINLELADASANYGPPKDWNEEVSGPCLTLSVADANINGYEFMVTLWQFTPEEKEAIANGANFVIGIAGHTSRGFPLLNLGIS